MRTYKNSTVDDLVKRGLCAACGKKLTEDEKKGGNIRCGVCRDDLQRHIEDLRKKRIAKKKCPRCGRSSLEPGLAVCRECAGLTEDVVEDWYPVDPSKKSKRKSYAKMSRVENAK